MDKPLSHVLLIEDNPGDADLIRLRLVEAISDVEVNCVDRLTTGLDSIEKKQPSLVLLDLNLPDSKGAETFRKVLSRAPGTPVVILSGQDDQELASKAVHQGAQDYLVKGDFDGKQLARAMRYAMDRQALLTSLDMSRKQQLELKDQFLSHVSHELRTPLTCIHQFVSILLDGLAGELKSEQRDHLETAMRSVNQLRHMIGDLLEATRAESGKVALSPRCMSIADAIRQAVAMFRASAERKRVGLEVALDVRTPLVYADPGRIVQVLTNLLDNAIKFTPPDGSVVVSTRLFETDKEFVYVSVSDTGRGISREGINLIFERLYQDANAIDDSRKGLGLGLYIAKHLVQRGGGRIWVESQAQQGSAFSFTVPVFSLDKLLVPVVSDGGKLRDVISLIKITLKHRSHVAVNWDGSQQQCLELIQSCLYTGRDLVMAAPSDGLNQDSFLVIASADMNGAAVIEKRISDQLHLEEEFKTACTLETSVREMQLPDAQAGESLEAVVHGIAEQIMHSPFMQNGNLSSASN